MFQSLFCWTINSKPLKLFSLISSMYEFQSLFCWTINSKLMQKQRLTVREIRFNPCSVGQLIQRATSRDAVPAAICFNPCSVGQLIQRIT